MPFSQHVCPYCDANTLFLRETDKGNYLQCHQCGARGPKAHQQTTPSILPSVSSKNLLRTMMYEAPGIVILKNYDGQFVLCNKALADLYNTTVEFVIGKTDADFNSNQQQVAFYLDNLREMLSSGQAQIVMETSTNAVSGEIRYYQSIKKPIVGPDGEHLLLIVAHDITELKEANKEIEESEKRYNYAMDASYSGMWDWDMVSNRVHHNLKWCEMLGLDDDMCVHGMEVLSELIHPEDKHKMMGALTRAVETNGEYSSEHRMVQRSGDVIWVLDRGRVVETNPQGLPVRMVGSFTDITISKMFEHQLEATYLQLERNNEKLEQLVQERTQELELAVEQLENLATRDQLTGLGNRVMLDQWLDIQKSDQKLVAILIDLDHFKSINDRYGHYAGDQFLKSAGQCLAQVRDTDVVVRWGGEEFLVILTGATTEQAYMAAEKLRLAIENAQILDYGEVLTASFGVCSKPVVKKDIDKAIQEADSALYQAKEAGRNKVFVYMANVDD